ncbi:MAG: hypothetical protein NTW16_08475 [Bacteroidetes bacterium]|nr:hypothetical protein [Bacteroidota bacterium]
MGFDDLFEQKHNKHGHYREQMYHDDYRSPQPHHHSYNRHDDGIKWMMIIQKLKESKKLRNLVITGGLIILVVAIGIIILLFPLLMKIFTYISENGLQGIWTSINDLISKIWSGSK